ncbi:helix-turn-helix domain-containing protein [Sphingomonas montana]|uniref:helix-turn-helix domain-containing protein n=1 Tax=Sphingomonas montana TaxID=1843236 RepID=UPI00096FAEE1|nr:helix-turn-helix domain-containing protein [Sphingomonas montana]
MEDSVTGKADAPVGRIGEQLAAARVASGLSLDDIAASTRIPLRHLETIEADGTDGLPAIPYTLGFVRSYARLVAIDPEMAAAAYRAHLNAAPATHRITPEPYEPADPARVPPKWLALLALLLAVAIAAGYGFMRSGRSDDTTIAATASDAPVGTVTGVAQSAPAPAPVQADGPVTLTATAPVWLSIYEKNGPKLFEREMAAGQTFQVPTAAIDPRLRTSRPQALSITVGNTAVPTVGEPDRLLVDQSLKAAALLGRPGVTNAAPGAAPGELVPQVITPLVPQGGAAPSGGPGA